MIEQEEFYKSYFFDDTTLPPNAMDLKRYLNSTHCYLCEWKFDWKKDYFPIKYENDLVLHGLRRQRMIATDPGASKKKGDKVVFHHSHQLNVSKLSLFHGGRGQKTNGLDIFQTHLVYS